ncbi:hypothetical protein BCR44DRAFT_1043100 [Catenaria anguillulae PL171]|uniref:Glycoside hydrolase/deacetylase n=1 Tax=Catenaria anguillulae PL171 TaxID=765915 RepID=A0A1Y2HU25_9FUNG|nr:hypothetical protein BCR44DRAFT_1043100 [Catenaria anguillulae PL171]
MTAFSGANVRLGFALAFKGPITIRRIELVGGSTGDKCVLPSADVGGCSANKVCPNGLCCSEYGWCGNTDTYCNSKCQSQCDLRPISGLRTCDSTPDPDPPSPAIPDPVSNPLDWVPSDQLKNGKFETDEFGSILDCGWSGMLALTYDDGPSPAFTPPILDALRDANVKATFFWLGSLVLKYGDVASRARNEGHHIASHSWSHPDLTKLSEADLANEVIWSEREIRNLVGLKPRFFRPPYISINQRVYNYLTNRGYRVILWSLDSKDWEDPTSPQDIINYYRDGAVSPSTRSYIAIQHDINPKSGNTENAAAVIRQVRANGFKPVPMYLCLNEYAYQGRIGFGRS